jgi:hypothetical protein
LIRSGRTLAEVPLRTLEAALAAWWELADWHSNHLGEEIQSALESAVFSTQDSVERFLLAVLEPRICAGQQHVPGLYRVAHEDKFRLVADRLALKWLRECPSANESVKLDLVKMAIAGAPLPDVRALVRAKLPSLNGEDIAAHRLWMSAAFLIDFNERLGEISAFFAGDKETLWTLRELMRSDRRDRHPTRPLTAAQLELVVASFGKLWPPSDRPTSTWGDAHPWDAAEFIRGCINALGAQPGEDASAALERLSSAALPYEGLIKHVRAQQRRLRRDTDFRVPLFDEVRRTLAGSLPGNIDDLKAFTLDRLDFVQDYIRNGETKAWEAFWVERDPKDENTCRNRLLDLLRAQVPPQIQFLPETLMPDDNRADIVVIYNQIGLPIEIKGQWHKRIWDAADVQLIQKYARDWRADDRGIYLVLWFGDVPRKNLPKHSDALPKPKSPDGLREMLVRGLPESERTRIDVVVLDVSRSPPA